MRQRLFFRGWRKTPSAGLKFQREASCTELPALGDPANCPRRPQFVSKTRVYVTYCFILLFPNQQSNTRGGSPGLLIFKMRALELGEVQGERERWAHTAPTPGDTSKLGAWPLLSSCYVTLGISSSLAESSCLVCWGEGTEGGSYRRDPLRVLVQRGLCL